jgi:hypothetical protein
MLHGTPPAVADSLVEPETVRPERPATDLRPVSVLQLVSALLAELRAAGEGVDCTSLPSVDQDAVRVPSSHVGEALLLPRRALERALAEPAARNRVRSFLRAWVERPRSRQSARGVALLTPYFAALSVSSLPGPRCPRCQGPLLAEDPVVVEVEVRSHLACPPAW